VRWTHRTGGADWNCSFYTTLVSVRIPVIVPALPEKATVNLVECTFPERVFEALEVFRVLNPIRPYPRNSVSLPACGEVFYGLRKEVLALDPCVSEKFLKLYVAYKAETNFVDVVPRAKRLRLTLNMPFVEIHDPKGICTNVTALASGATAISR
jgi:predicted transport protein